jgi:4-hydroxybenzoate polyprenyltransferase
VVLGACINSWLISRIISLQIPVSSVIGLAICVWLIYTADHLIDAYHIKHNAGTRRHLFHQKFFYSLTSCFIVISIFGFINIWFLPPRTLLWGGIIFLFVVAYLIFIAGLRMKLGNIKEVIVAITYAATIFMVPLSLYSGKWHPHLFIAFLQLFLIAFLNLLIFSLIDHSIDQKDDHKSLVRIIGKKMCHRVINLSLIILLASFIITFTYFQVGFIFYAEIVYLVMALVLLFIYLKRSFLINNEHYRLLGDLVFSFPIMLFFI